MTEIELRLSPAVLDNPDADLRYVIPDLLVVRSGGAIRDNGYDYEGDGPEMVISLLTDDLPAALTVIDEVLGGEPILGNRLAGNVTVTVLD